MLGIYVAAIYVVIRLIVRRELLRPRVSSVAR